MTYQIRVHGLTELENNLMHKNSVLREATFKVMKDNMEVAVELSRAEAESRGWKLANEIRVGAEDAEAGWIEGGCYAWYAAFPEFGTSRYPAKPYWRQYVWASYFAMLSDINQLIKELNQSMRRK